MRWSDEEKAAASTFAHVFVQVCAAVAVSIQHGHVCRWESILYAWVCCSLMPKESHVALFVSISSLFWFTIMLMSIYSFTYSLYVHCIQMSCIKRVMLPLAGLNP